MEDTAWPALTYSEWAPTKKTLHMVSQMLGKLRLALSPALPEWLNCSLQLDARGFSTGPMPYRDRVVTGCIDVFEGLLELAISDGRAVRIDIVDRCVRDVWSEFVSGLAELGIEAPLDEKPQEVSDTTRFSRNGHDCTLDVVAATHFHRLLCTLDGVFEEFRSDFFGRTGVQFWWGAFDFAVLLFSGKALEPPDDKGYIMRYDLDAEHFNAGFWPGDDTSPEPIFYGYLVPRPDGCDVAAMRPEHASWVEAMEEWVLPYEAVRTSPDPRQAVLDFLASIYEVAVTSAGWDGSAFKYVKPPTARA